MISIKFIIKNLCIDFLKSKNTPIFCLVLAYNLYHSEIHLVRKVSFQNTFE